MRQTRGGYKCKRAASCIVAASNTAQNGWKLIESEMNMGICKFAYLNDRIIATEEAQISPFDRGFLFAHAAYEVTAVYGGQLIDADGHIARLERTLAGIAIPMMWSGEEIIQRHKELLERNGMIEGRVYLQITAGAYGFRDFTGPDEIRPNLFMYCEERELIGAAARDGIEAIIVPDTRWSRRDLKTTQLMSQALAFRSAKDAGAETAWMIEDGYITEAASANAWIVDENGTLITRDLSNAILPGITRASVIHQLGTDGRKVEARRFTPDEAKNASEAFTTSAGALIAPIVMLDSHKIGDGMPGPVTRRVQRLYYQKMGADVSMIDWL